MKFKSSLAVTLLFTLAVINFQCRPEPDPDPTPKSELILGSWETTEMKHDGVIQPEGPYANIVFTADSTVVYNRYDLNGDPELQFEDVWTISNDEKQIVFQGESDVDLIELTETKLTIEYTSVDPNGSSVERTDTFEKL